MRIQLTKHLAQANITNIVLFTAIYIIMWLLPLFMGNTYVSENDKIPTLFLQRYVLWELSAQAASMIGMIVWGAILIGIWTIATKHSLVPSHTIMPIIIGSLFVSNINCLHYFDQRHIALILLLFALDDIMNLYDFKLQIKSAFNNALLLGLASLFEPLYAWFILLFIIALSVYRVVTWRTLATLITGLALIVYTTLSVAWLTDNVEIITNYATNIVNFEIPNFSQWRVSDFALLAVIAALWVFSLSKYMSKLGSYNLNLRLNTVFVNWSMIYSVILCVFAGALTQHIILVPLSLIFITTSILYSGSNNNTTNISFIFLSTILIVYRIFWTLGF